MIKPIKKPKKKKNQTIKYWRNKADKLLQETGRIMYEDNGCLVCGGEYSCMHHFIYKSQSTYLRYKWINLIPICGKCHFKHHNGDSKIHLMIGEIKGKEWRDEILLLAKKDLGAYHGYLYYKDMYNTLKLLEPIKL